MNYLDPVLTPLINLDPDPSNPIMIVFLIASLIALMIVLLQKWLIDYDKMEELQAEMKEVQAEAKAAQKSGDPKAMAKVQKKQMELMPKNKELMTMQMKPTLITMIPILIIFYGLSGNAVISNMAIHISQGTYFLLLMPIWEIFWKSPIPLTINWIGWYIVVSFAMSFLFRKLFGLKSF
jgi:uncharacterized membrane protein (DUF106 family)